MYTGKRLRYTSSKQQKLDRQQLLGHNITYVTCKLPHVLKKLIHNIMIHALKYGWHNVDNDT